MVLEAESRHKRYPPSDAAQTRHWIWNAKALAAVARAKPPTEPWHVQYKEFSLEEMIRRLYGLGAIMPLLFGVVTVLEK